MYRIVFLVVSVFGFVTEINAQQVEILPASEFQKKLKEVRGYLLDVRTDWEFASGYIEGAINADIHEEKFRALAEKLDHHHPCFVYCFSGGRSQEAGVYLLSKGFSKVYELQGGIAAWQKAGLAISKKSTN